ncbi:MAG: TIGR03905 family TSCPD domain-containing protein [Lachnospiraceae bacterium]|nr:TIGR03905 family TSCPD domain-containing protein [Lachnospiraceae bacterium]
MGYSFKTTGSCAVSINFDIRDNKLKNLEFIGGCEGNHKGIAKLVEGMDIDEVIKKTQGITCGRKNTSCPDQLAKALIKYKSEQNEQKKKDHKKQNKKMEEPLIK